MPAIRTATPRPASDIDARLRILEPTVPGAPCPVQGVSETYSEEEAKALYKEGIEFLREMAASSPSATARSQAAAKLAAFFVSAAHREKPRRKIVVSFIDPRLLAEDEPEDFIA